MRETILLAPGANAAELLRSLARFGKNTIGLRVMAAAELAGYVLQCGGQSVTERFLPRREETAVLFSFVRQIGYFSAASVADAESLAAALYSARSLVCGEPEQQKLEEALGRGEFPEKNLALLEAYGRYCRALAELGAVDTVALIRRAVSAGAPPDADFVTLREFPLSPLEQTLLARASGGRARTLSLCELFGRAPRALQFESMTEAYGAANEAEQLVGAIFDGGLPLDRCTVAVTDPSQYAQLFYELSLLRGIPVTFGCGVPIFNSNPAQLLQALYRWDTEGYHGVDALRRVIFSEAFDRQKLFARLGAEGGFEPKSLPELVKMAGFLRLSADGVRNAQVIREYRAVLGGGREMRLLSGAERLGAELARGFSALLRDYSVLRSDLAGRVDQSALQVLCESLDFFAAHTDETADRIIPALLNKTVCSENSRAGCLYLTDIGGALSACRENLFVMGLSASLFPGAASENHLLLDSDLQCFAADGGALTAAGRIAARKQQLRDLLGLAASLGVPARLSYSGYDLAGLKRQNPSSVLPELFREQQGAAGMAAQFEAALRHVGFFARDLSPDAAIGRAVCAGAEMEPCRPAPLGAQSWAAPERAFSPTAIETFFACPMRFYLEKLLGIRLQSGDDPFVVIAANDLGQLAHAQMAAQARCPLGRADFIAAAEKRFDDFLKSRPPLHPDAAVRERQNFVQMMKNAFDGDPGNEVLSAEQSRTVRHPSGILLQGTPDRVERTPRGDYLVVDYKTGRQITHRQDDIDSCLQAVLYAFLLEQSGVPVSRCEYRYLRSGKTVTCAYDGAVRNQLDARLQQFRTALDSAAFPCAEKCAGYCGFESICGRNKLAEEAAEE